MLIFYWRSLLIRNNLKLHDRLNIMMQYLYKALREQERHILLLT